jgi:hypothetical protein
MFRGLLSIFQRKPAADVTIVHPQLGPLKYYEEGFWSGRARSEPEIEITVAGDQVGPNARQAERLVEHLKNFSALENQINDFLEQLLNADPVIKPSDFHLQSVDFLWKQDGHFMVYMKMDGDEHSLWRIEFVDDQAKYLGRDS